MTRVRAGYSYVFYSVMFPIAVLFLAMVGAVRISGLSGFGLGLVLATCLIGQVALVARVARCGLVFEGTMCTVTRMWSTRTYDLAGSRSISDQPTLTGKATLVPAVQLSDGRKLVFHVLNGASHQSLWNYESALIKFGAVASRPY